MYLYINDTAVMTSGEGSRTFGVTLGSHQVWGRGRYELNKKW